MSGMNGDKARFNKYRRRKLAKRQRVWAFFAAQQAAPKAAPQRKARPKAAPGLKAPKLGGGSVTLDAGAFATDASQPSFLSAPQHA